MNRTNDKSLLVITIILVIVGFFIFTSASLGLLTREGARFSSVAASQILLGAFLGFIALTALSRFNYKRARPLALWGFGVACLVTLLVFVPGLGREFGGAHSWLIVGPVSFQPAELLKFMYVIALAALLSNPQKGRLADWRKFIAFAVLTTIAVAILIVQPDFGTSMVLIASGTAMLFVSGAKMRNLLIAGLVLLVFATSFVFLYPHALSRITTFLHPERDPLGAGYQIQQSLIAVGSGEFFGRGFGQSLQKFNHLPEPIGDSIFAVFAEEFGFLGCLVLLSAFLLFALRGFRIATRAPDYFGALLVVGCISLITFQSLINVAAVLGVLPLTGLPLVFISHGGTALLFALAEVGIVLSVSRKAVS